jgi:hypothetical protein
MFNNENDPYNDGMAALDVLTKTQELINFLLRYVVAGGSAVLAFGLTQQDPFSFLRVEKELSVLLLLLFVFVIGPAIYSIHRAALHPFILVFIFNLLRVRNRLDKITWRQWSTLDRVLAKQKETWRTPIPSSPLLGTYEGWAAQAHFLYCSAFGTGFALGLARFNSPANHFAEILTVGSILFGAALVCDWRVTNWEIHRVLEKEDNELKTKP